MWKIIYLCFAVLIANISAKLYDCPSGWDEYNGYCYKFVGYPRSNYQQANTACMEDGASLVSVGSEEEHRFIVNWLEQNDQRRDAWFTSGGLSSTVSGGIQWNGDGTFSQGLSFWLNGTDPSNNRDGSKLVYKFSGTEYAWSTEPSTSILSFICEISQVEAYRIVEDNRDFDYGLDIIDPNLVPRGPDFLIEPEDTVILGETTSMYLDCVATGMPLPKYTWHKINSTGKILVSYEADNRYTLTNGRLSIANPSSVDESDYQCLAENSQGMALSQRVKLSFGSLGEFSNVETDQITSYQHDGTQMKCPSITFKPAIVYQWYKDYVPNFVRPSLQKHIFISDNGKMYFSEVTTEDAGRYHCMVTLATTGVLGNYIGAYQAPSRASLGFNLVVKSQAAGNFQPQIQDDFISVFPGNPKRGQSISLECFAFGTGPLFYSWERIGINMPKGVTLDDHNRKLLIPNVQLEDQGIYRCRVYSSKTQLSDTEDYTLRIESKPYFTFPLKHQHVDMNDRLTWHCDAGGSPMPTYRWYKNGVPVTNQTGIITASRNTLRIENLQKEHAGMYQCAASNVYGTVFSTAQLRILEFKPSFKKYPLEKRVAATNGGNVTYVCNPEAAPAPVYKWLKNGRDLGLTPGTISGNMRMLMNGNLYIEGVQQADQGTYTCEVENSLGKASSSGQLTVVEETRITRNPSPERVIINSTATMICEGSFNPKMDMVYNWLFNKYPIDFEDNSHYRMGSGVTQGYLYILGAQFTHAGSYTCQVSTGLDEQSASAILTVLGPPGEPAGLFRDVSDLSQPRTVRLLWTDGSTNGAEILYYVIEFSTNFDTKWRILLDRLYVGDAISARYTSKKIATLTNLKPGAGYLFRVRAMNRYGLGAPSQPSAVIQIPSDIPKKAPDNVGGGGGKVGDLRISWTPMNKEDLNGNNLGYTVYWRKKPTQSSESKWEERRVNGAENGEFFYTVGDENFYLDYEVRVRAFNEIGAGNLSDIVTIKSAEALPTGTPRSVFSDSFNSTALMVYWKPVTDTRSEMKGKLIGYKINYWRKDVDIETGAPQNILSGQIDHGLIIGLEADTWYTVNVQVYNGAGNGPKSELYHQSTDRPAPQLYPTEIYVNSHSEDSVRVTFRGVSTQSFEEPLQGYKVQYWRTGENIRSALHVDCEKNNNAVVPGLERGVVYQLRVFGYSQGGQGKMSSPATYFTLGGEVRVDPSSTEILAGSSAISPVVMVLLLCSVLALLFQS
ncbi:hypothetical protein SNE40_014772 [Patella caerulea]|uniref:Contactin n=1 Tax=Patella caerulea TaxID=87958 RepID=A0AAN8JGB5_PATCE